MHSGLTTLYPNTNAVFSPDDKYVVTGGGSSTKGGSGRLLFLKKETLEEVKSLVVDSTPVKVVWHTKINQVRLEIKLRVALRFNSIIDCHGSIERADRGALLAGDVLKWSEATIE